MKRFLLMGAVLAMALICISNQSEAACGRIAQRVGAVVTSPVRLLKAVHARRCHRSTTEPTEIVLEITVEE